MSFIREDDRGYNVFEFNCPHCQTTGEVGIPKNQTGLVRHDCGVLIRHLPGYEGIRRPEINVFIQSPLACYGSVRAGQEGN